MKLINTAITKTLLCCIVLLIAARGTLLAQAKVWGISGINSAVFTINPDGSGMQTRHIFSTATVNPGLGNQGNFNYALLEYTRLTPMNGKLYGTRFGGGPNQGCNSDNHAGVLFQFDPLTGQDSTLYNFSLPVGCNPEGTLIAIDGILWGTTTYGGNSNLNNGSGFGTIFSFNTATGEFTTVYKFSGAPDGGRPSGTLFLNPSDKLLYGMTSNGGPTSAYSGTGTLFSIDPAAGGSSFQVRANYGGAAGLTLYNNLLYGVAGGYTGFVFSYDPATAVFTQLAQLGGQSTAGLALFNDGKLYGLMQGGGKYGNGDIFSFDPATGTLTNVFDFLGGQYGNTTGAKPYGDMIVYNNLLWGTTSAGGLSSNNGGNGVLYSFDPAAKNFQVQYAFGANDGKNNTNFEGNSPYAGVTVYNNKLYGILPNGGVNGGGTIFSWDPAANVQVNEIEFNLQNLEGTQPSGLLCSFNNMVYGTCNGGGLNKNGTMYSVNPANNSFTKLADLNASTTGSGPSTPVAAANGKLYLATGSGGSQPTNGLGNAEGTILELDPATGKTTVLYTFSNSYTTAGAGGAPVGPLVAIGNTLYGVASDGANQYGDGAIFSFDIVTRTYTPLFYFDETNPAIGGYAASNMVYANGLFFGTNNYGGVNSQGNLWSFDPKTKQLKGLYDYKNYEYISYLTVHNGMVYGYSSQGGASFNGYVLSVNPATGAVTDYYDAGSRTSPYFSFYKGVVLGTTYSQGANGAGNLFSVDTATKTVTDLYDFNKSGPYYPVGITLVKSIPSINFANLKATYGQTDFTLNATSTNANAANPVTYTIADPTIATITNGKIHILKAGTTIITAGQIEDEDYYADTVQRVLTVAKAPLTITAQPVSISYGSPVPTNFTVVYTGFAGTDDATVLTGAPVFSTTAMSSSVPGNYPINVDTTGMKAANYYFVAQPGQLTISQATPTIQFGTIPATITYGDAPIDPAATSNSGASPVYTSSNTAVATITGDNKVQFTGAGTATITAAFPATPDYTAGSKNLTITVSKKALNLTVDDAYMQAGTALPNFTVTFSGLVNGDPASVITPAPQFATTATSGSSAGTYPITVSNISSLAAANYTISSGYQQGTLTIGSIGFSGGDTRTYGATPYGPGAVSSTGATPVYTSSNSQVAIINGNNQVQIVGAGQTTITASFAASGSTPAASAQQTLTVQPAPLTIKAADASRPYGQPNPAFGFTYQGFVYNDNAASLPTPPQGGTSAGLSSATGTYTIIPYGAVSSNYTITYANGTLTVAQAPQTIQFGALPTKSTGNPDYSLSATASSGLTVTYSSSNPNVAIISGNTVHITGAGVTTITASQSGDADYLPAPNVQQTLTVNGLASSLNLGSIPVMVYGAPDFTITATSNNAYTPITYASSNPAVATIDASGVIHLTGAGVTTITASQAGNSTYSPGSSVPQTLNVSRAPLVVTVYNQTIFQGQSPAGFVVGYSGFVNGDDTMVIARKATASTPANANSPVGSYPLYVGGASAANYSFSYVQGQVTILPAQPQAVSFNVLPAERYGNPDFDPGASTTSGEPIVYTTSDPTVATIVNGRVHITGAGRVTITATQPGGNGYNSASSIAQTITVGKAPLLIRPNDVTLNLGQSLPVFTVNYTGFVNGDDSASLTRLPVVNTPAPGQYPGFGQYTIVASGAVSSKYDITYGPGALIVTANSDQINAFSSAPGMLTVSIYTNTAQKATIQLYSLGGGLITQQQVQLAKTVNNFTINTGNIAPGIYIVKVWGEASRFSQKIKIN